MDEDAGALKRGSDRMFDASMKDAGVIAEAIGVVRGDFEIKWWWKYGKPAFVDYIKGGLHVRPDRVGKALEQLLRLNSSEVQVTASVFPYGITNPDLFQVEIEMRRGAGG